MPNQVTLAAKIEALLFFKAEPLAIKKLVSLLDVPANQVEKGIEELQTKLDKRGIVLMQKGDEVYLGTNPELGNFLEKIAKEELKKDLGRAGSETLSIILYLGPISRTDIDYVRGVNSTFILRHLLIRGLIERVENPADRRSYLYQPTFELLRYLGVKKIEELPEYETMREEMVVRKEEEKKFEAEVKES